MLKRVEADLTADDKRTDEAKKLVPADKIKLYSLAQRYMAMLSSHDRNRTKLAEAKAASDRKRTWNMA
jgi:hypothetical protein